MSFAALVDIHRRAQPSRPALHYEGQVCTWSQLEFGNYPVRVTWYVVQGVTRVFGRL